MRARVGLLCLPRRPGDSYTDIVRGAFDDPGETADQYDFSSGAAQHEKSYWSAVSPGSSKAPRTMSV